MELGNATHERVISPWSSWEVMRNRWLICLNMVSHARSLIWNKLGTHSIKNITGQAKFNVGRFSQHIFIYGTEFENSIYFLFSSQVVKIQSWMLHPRLLYEFSGFAKILWNFERWNLFYQQQQGAHKTDCKIMVIFNKMRLWKCWSWYSTNDYPISRTVCLFSFGS